MEAILKYGMPWKRAERIIKALGLTARPCRHGARLVDPVTKIPGTSARKDPANPSNANGYLVRFLKKVIRARRELQRA
jgi:hypothetical protein